MSAPSTKPKIALGADHAGYSLKEIIRKHLEEAGYAIEDLGTWSEESVDYPDFGKAVGEHVISRRSDLGITVCGTGIGISIAANKVPGVRAAVAHDVMTARLAREHNDANVIAFGARLIGSDMARACVLAFLGSDFAGGRHQRRVDLLSTALQDSD